MSEDKIKEVEIPVDPDEWEVEWPDPRPDPDEEPTEPWARREVDE